MDIIKFDVIGLMLNPFILMFISVTLGMLFGMIKFGKFSFGTSGAICGGMTSTPGLGAATDAVGSDDPGAGYGATYPFALFGMVIFTIVLMKLPLL